MPGDRYEDIHDWYLEQSPALAASFLAEFHATTARLKSAPRLYSAVYFQSRRAPMGRFPYFLMYQINTSTREIWIVAACHAKRHPRHWQVRENSSASYLNC